MAAYETTRSASRRIEIPGGLTVSVVQEGHGGGIEVNQMLLLAAVGIVACVTGSSPIIVQMFGV